MYTHIKQVAIEAINQPEEGQIGLIALELLLLLSGGDGPEATPRHVE